MITQIKNDMAALIDTQGEPMAKADAAFWYVYLNALLLAVLGLFGVVALNVYELYQYGKHCFED